MSNNRSMVTYSGLATARGFASGQVFLYRGDGEIAIPEYRIEPGQENAEVERLRFARDEARRDIEGLIAVLRERTKRDDVKIFECHLMILEDPMLTDGAKKLILEERYNAAAATRKVSNKAREQFSRMNDPYFRERVRDLDDVERRLLKAILQTDGGTQTIEIKTPSIVIADDITPSETLRLPREYLLGFATNGGSTTSHVALLARALGIPAVTGLGNITSSVEPGDTVLLDGTNGVITVNPDEGTMAEFKNLERRQQVFLDSIANGPPAGTLKDGSQILLFSNIHPGVPFAGIRELGSRGIGLYRSEYLWLSRELEPTEEEQFTAYRDVAKFAATMSKEATVTIRVLDIGGDKTVRGITAKEANPFLGNRSIRYLLSHVSVFKTQLRAILRASAYGPICIMYPMVSCVEELMEASKLLEEVKQELSAANIPFTRDIPVGAMIEVPAAAINAEAIAKYVSFFSIGTNDLIQYTMAADRGNESVAHLYQPMNPAILHLMRHVIDTARKCNIHVGVCGESAADPVVGILWAAMGSDMLSMSSSYIPVVASILRRLTKQDLADYLDYVLSLGNGISAEETYRLSHQWLTHIIPDLDDLLI